MGSKMDSGISITAEKLVDITARVASKIKVEDREIEKAVGISSFNLAKKSVEKVAFWLTESRNSLLYCKLCGKGPFTKRGLYLHLIRLHRNEIKTMLEEELKNEIRAII
ncbi:hypothetical protein STK_05070 [Sulfurisphaera tokodaii str. 7]|uniref:Uncharacterized protein n=3 Tax=Sulfurisphaera TaxID=69655 RepID=Q975A5_SULTO|nr:hypothetical protein STK_05070 [Sulfurisphaera tokodaii str. 7]